MPTTWVTAISAFRILIQKFARLTSTNWRATVCASPTPTVLPGSAHPVAMRCSPAASIGENSTRSSTVSVHPCSTPPNSRSPRCSRKKAIAPRASVSGTSVGIGTPSSVLTRNPPQDPATHPPTSTGPSPSPAARAITASTTILATTCPIFHPTHGLRTTASLPSPASRWSHRPRPPKALGKRARAP